MPFTTQENREKMIDLLRRVSEKGEIPKDAKVDLGDWCFLAYREMMIEWQKAPRWTTAHNLRRKMENDIRSLYFTFTLDGGKVHVRNDQIDIRVAHMLAWEVFFNLHVMEYERKKREKNGEVGLNFTFEG